MRAPLQFIAVAAITCVITATVSFAQASGSQTSRAEAPKPSRTFIPDYNCARPSASLSAHVEWRAEDSSIKWGEWRVALGSKRLPVVVVVAILAPTRTKLALGINRDGDELGAWSIANAPLNARLAINAGQFTDAGPWGWVIHNGREQQKPGVGSLAGAFIVDTSGRWSLIDASEIQANRLALHVREAVQSYPTLIGIGGTVPRALCSGSKDINLTHRDTRLALGTMPTGELIVAMTRFDGLGEAAGRLPIGPTTPEMVTIMRALGATRALMLDGGLSAQMLLRTATVPIAQEWNGLRKVPLALVGVPVPITPPPD
ncbi:MAG: phosphodiester glycosidase family protein [Gemmatimonas sp.]